MENYEDANNLNAELYPEIVDLKEKLNEFKMMHVEDMQYKEAVEGLISEGIINSDLSQRMKF